MTPRDPLADWGNGALDGADDREVATEVGPVRIRRQVREVGGGTVWSIAVTSAQTCEVRREGPVGAINRLLGLTRRHPAAPTMDYRGERELAVALLAAPEVAQFLATVRRFSLTVEPGRVTLSALTTNVDADEARAGVATVRACARIIGERQRGA